jgi:hypothetical protein
MTDATRNLITPRNGIRTSACGCMCRPMIMHKLNAAPAGAPP